MKLVKKGLFIAISTMLTATSYATQSTCNIFTDDATNRVMNVNSPKISAASCWKDHLYYGGSVNLIYEKANSYSPSTGSESYFNVRTAKIFLDAQITDRMVFHMSTTALSKLKNNIPKSDEELSDKMKIKEAFISYRGFLHPDIYLKVGHDWTFFGNYEDPYPNVYSINESLVFTHNTNAAIGYVSPYGFDFEAYIYEDEVNDKWDQFGLRFGYDGSNIKALNAIKFEANLSYIDNYSTLRGKDASNEEVPLADANESMIDFDVKFELFHTHFDIEYLKANGDLVVGTANTAPEVVSLIAEKYIYLNGNKAIIHGKYEKSSGASALNDDVFKDFSPEKHFKLGASYYLDKFTKASFDLHKFKPYDSAKDDQNQAVLGLKIYF
ncbi:MAG: hypothetical protein VX335_01490 [Pseudomonadota bacterium]|nr:hypothetical protein [Pseudomonadota bacterium]